MAIGSNTEISFSGNEKDLDEIYNIANDGDEGDFYLRVFGISMEEYNSWNNEQEHAFLEKVGVNSMCQSYCSARRSKDNVEISVYSTYDTPVGIWKHIAEKFPKAEAFGTVIREDDPNCKKGRIKISKSVFSYSPPEICK